MLEFFRKKEPIVLFILSGFILTLGVTPVEIGLGIVLMVHGVWSMIENADK
jgi:hypothetical protein